eukprot:CAMPEP_0178404688 /NCGR_PEP_ID=MMETSP0689_2-20121128/18014_1 /TAXON_ID=160604 /ORGANISM="Amphidinium massartii, Strain CS-259" /LENGTH=323 /DNA_ID=CAMNT_0020025683 /DNA_START=68 /DNA_END=1040 /DNA_ORIENTATION=-
MSSLGGLCSSAPRDDDETMNGKPSTDSRRSGGNTAAAAAASEGSGTVAVVPREKLFVSEPDPRMFGNERNPSAGAGWTNGNWLKSRFHFSFAEYFNGPGQYGVVRVLNDDLVQPMRGFGTHPHRDMEIITFIVEGELTHQDSMGTKETLGKGSVQFMTAGTGVRHSEHNLQKAAPLRFIQTWVVPRSRGLRPNYGSFSGCTLPAAEARRNRWAHLVADVEAEGDNEAPVRINQDCNMYAMELEPGLTSPPLEIRHDRQAYMLCMEGDIVGGLRNKQLRRHDAAELKGDLQLRLTSGKDGAFVLVFEWLALVTVEPLTFFEHAS